MRILHVPSIPVGCRRSSRRSPSCASPSESAFTETPRIDNGRRVRSQGKPAGRRAMRPFPSCFAPPSAECRERIAGLRARPARPARSKRRGLASSCRGSGPRCRPGGDGRSNRPGVRPRRAPDTVFPVLTHLRAAQALAPRGRRPRIPPCRRREGCFDAACRD